MNADRDANPNQCAVCRRRPAPIQVRDLDKPSRSGAQFCRTCFDAIKNLLAELAEDTPAVMAHPLLDRRKQPHQPTHHEP